MHWNRSNKDFFWLSGSDATNLVGRAGKFALEPRSILPYRIILLCRQGWGFDRSIEQSSWTFHTMHACKDKCCHSESFPVTGMLKHQAGDTGDNML